jgi:2-polyprenyl-3-methyl-5-hydroxy-6-metoxy-1,4-benzoquinol methylase
MRIVMYVWPTKFLFARRVLSAPDLRILDIGCGNNSPSVTKHWFPNCHYSGADIQEYNNSADDMKAMDDFYPIGLDGSGYSAIPDRSFDLVVLHHVIEHMVEPTSILAVICSKLKPGGYIWIAFPSLRSLSFPSAAEGTLQFCDDDTHIYVPDIREVSNVLLANGVNVLHAGRTRDFVRTLVGVVVLPWALLRKLITGKFVVRGLWYVLGFEDHVFGQRKLR